MVARRLTLGLSVVAVVAGLWVLAAGPSSSGGRSTREGQESLGDPARASGTRLDTAPRMEGDDERREPEVALIESVRRITGRVLGVDGWPLAGIRVAFRGHLTPSPVFVESGEDGRFETPPLEIGRVWAMHAPSGNGAYRASWLPLSAVSPSGTTSFELTPGGGPFEHDLVLRRPPAVLDVLVVDQRGNPAPQMWVSFQGRSRIGPGGEPADVLERYGLAGDVRDQTLYWQEEVNTDEIGRAHLALWPMQGFLGGELLACSTSYRRTSLPLPVEAPFVPGLRTLTVLASPSLDVVVRDPNGTPHSGLSVWIESLARRHIRRTALLPGGVYRFEAVPLGPCRVLVENPFTGVEQEKTIELESSASQEVLVELEEGSRRVLFDGGLVDEHGDPLVEEAFSFEFSVDGGPFERGSAKEGRFTAWGMPGDVVLVRGIVGPWTQPFEPSEFRVSSGTRGLTFRRTATLPMVEFQWTAVDASTGTPIEAALILDRGEGTESESFDGRGSPAQALAYPDLRWRAIAVGYLETGGLVRDQVQSEWGETLQLHAELQPGFELDLQLFDAETWEPIPGVVFSSKTAPSATSDILGRVRLRADHWPTYRVSHPDYESFEFPFEEKCPDSWADPRWFLLREE